MSKPVAKHVLALGVDTTADFKISPHDSTFSTILPLDLAIAAKRLIF